MSPFAFYAPHLRKLGFRKTYTSRAGGDEVREWKRDEPIEDHTFARTLIVQIWALGGHRVTHDLFHDPERQRGGCSTVPTPFDNPGELRAAIEIERTRTDNSYYIKATSK
jgi:hypothetical protein